jgi:glycosyltransferase involved in cell wall biosynthesis
MRHHGIVMLVSNVDSLIGGTERQARLLATELTGRGTPVVIVTQSAWRSRVGPAASSEAPTVPIVRLPTLRRLPAWSFLVSFLLWGAIHRRRFDVIHAHNTSLGVIASIAGSLLRKPVIAKVTEMKHAYALGNPARLRRLRRWMLTRHARLIALSTEMRAVLAEVGVPAGGIDLVPNGVAFTPPVPRDDRAALRARWLGTGTDAVVLFVGRLIERKRVDQLLHVWAAMPPPEHAVLCLVGHGPLRASLEAMADRLGLRNSVRFVGLQTDVTPFYLMADTFVLPSRTEGMSNALLEAMAAGLPVIASDIPVNREIVQFGENGFLVDWSDVPATAAVLSTVVADPLLRRTLGRAAVERAAEFSIGAVAERYRGLYHALSAARRVA